MVHLSFFCLKLDLVIAPVEQFTFLVECDLDCHLRLAEQRYDWPQLVVDYSIWDDSGWLMAEGQSVGWTSPSLY